MASKTEKATTGRKNLQPKAPGRKQQTIQNQTIYGSVDELAREIGISRQAAYAALRRGTIPSIRIGKRFVLPKSAIAEWLRRAGNQVVVQ